MDKNKSQKKYRKIRKTYLWLTVIEFILLAVCMTVLLVYAARNIGLYIVDSKMAAEYERIRYMGRLYDESLKNKESNGYSLLEEEGLDYLIVGSDGRILKTHGKNTCSDEEGIVTLPGYDEEITIYKDSERGYIYPGRNKKLSLNILEFREWLIDEGFEDDETGLADLVVKTTGSIELPIWISTAVDNGKEQLICKAVFRASDNDVDMFAGIVIATIVLSGIILIVMLVTAIRNIIRQRRMLKLFFTDVTTENHNYTWLLVKGEKMLRRKAGKKNRFAVVNLKFVNYNTFCACHSSAEGEEILCRIDRMLNSRLRRNEMCAHLGAANFGLILKYTDEEELRTRLETIISDLEATDPNHKLNFRAGVSLTDRATDDAGNPVNPRNIDFNTEFNHASMARTSIGAGDDSRTAFFDDELIEEQKWLDKVQEHQQSALDNEEFVVYYQPKYDPRTDKLRGAEALVRWISPEMGFVSPGKFIPIFEKNGFITEIDHYMIRHVAADQKRWLDEGRTCVPVSVNVSRAHFIESDLAEQIRDMVDEAGTPHEYIEIELTESAFFDDKEALLSTINRLKSYGFAVSMDDFGSGYSSLNSLKDMPLDVLKLDAEFFRGETKDNRAEIVVSEAIKLGKSLNMRIVAEGVEQKEQVDFLADQGCDMIQGYYYAKPMPGNEYEQRLQ